MLTHFGTVFALCHNYDSLTLLNFHKNNVSRGTVAKWMFHVEQIRWMLKTVSRGTKYRC